MARIRDSYRGFRRNSWFGRKPRGNTKSPDRIRRPVELLAIKIKLKTMWWR